MEFMSREGFRRRMEKKDFIFDSTSDYFSGVPSYNDYYIKSQQNYFNDILAVRGYVFLNDVLKSFGIKPTVGGQLAGWKKGPIEIRVTQTMYKGVEIKEYFLRFNHEGFILDVLGD